MQCVPAMLKRAQRLAQSQKKTGSEQPPRRRVTSKDFSLRDSPLTRILAFNVGRGDAASGMQKVSAAAVAESGLDNVHRRRLLAHQLSRALLEMVLVVSAFNALKSYRYCLGILNGIKRQIRITHGGIPSPRSPSQ